MFEVLKSFNSPGRPRDRASATRASESWPYRCLSNHNYTTNTNDHTNTTNSNT